MAWACWVGEVVPDLPKGLAGAVASHRHVMGQVAQGEEVAQQGLEGFAESCQSRSQLSQFPPLLPVQGWVHIISSNQESKTKNIGFFRLPRARAPMCDHTQCVHVLRVRVALQAQRQRQTYKLN